MHAIKDRAVVVDGQIVVRPIMVVALTYDHRLLDGREAALRYESPLARVQGRADAANTLLFLQSVAALGGAAAAHVDAAAATRWLARTLGAPAEVLVPRHSNPEQAPHG